ncbi:MAG TPA: B-box zinc finger protein [Desulfosporosinus sp.]|nr:B-box zinc finger protein [Desulfosporosinus sp.]
MKCKYHPAQEAQSICEKCKQPICSNCTIKVGDKAVCRHCVEQNLLSEQPMLLKRSFSSKLLFFIFSLIPGAAHMHMGLFRRGLQLMIITFGGTSLISFIGLDFLIPIVLIPAWFFSFFESHHLRRQLVKGQIISDDDLFNRQIFDYTPFLINRRLIGFSIIILGIFSLLHELERSSVFNRLLGNWYYVYDLLKGSVIPLCLVLGGIYLIAKTKKPTKPRSDINND